MSMWVWVQERRVVSARQSPSWPRQPGLHVWDHGLSHTMLIVFAGFVTASISYNDDRRGGMNLDKYLRVFAIDVVLCDQDGRRIQPLCGEGAARHDCGRIQWTGSISSRYISMTR
jgi:hypothetical protein